MKQLATYFLRGLAFVVPIALTVWIFVVAFQTIDGLLPLRVPGAGLLVLVVATVACGFLVSNFLTGRIMSWVERSLQRLPLVRLLYSSLRDLMGAFVGGERRMGRPVLVELEPTGTLRAIGFITRESLEELELADSVAVYLPQSYNFAGQLLVVPRSRVHPLPGEGAALMQLIVSGGVAGLTGNRA